MYKNTVETVEWKEVQTPVHCFGILLVGSPAKVNLLVISNMGLSENVVYPEKPNGFADHYPYEKWLFHWEYTQFSDKPISLS